MYGRFNIVFSGELVGDIRAEEAIKRLVSIFGLSAAKARNLILDGQRHVLKRDIDAETADKYRVALERAGLRALVEPAEPLTEELSLIPTHAPIPLQEDEGIRCPACGSQRLEKGICLDCGVAWEKPHDRHDRQRGQRTTGAGAPDSHANPYAAPRASLPPELEEGTLAGPGKVPAGHGWRWIARGFWHFKTGALAWILITVVFIAISIFVGLIPFIGALATSILSQILIGGVMFGAREQDEGRNIRVEHLFAGFSINPGQLALVGVLYLVGAILIVLVAGLSMAATLVPIASTMDLEILEAQNPEAMFSMMGPSMLAAGLVASLFFIPLIMAVLFAPALVILNGMSATAAMKLSFIGCLKNVLPFLIFGLIGLVLVVLGSLPFGLGLVVVWPTLMAAGYVAYRDIFYEISGG